MGKHYDEAAIPGEMRRGYDVYDRIGQLGIDLGSFEEDVVSLAGAGIAKAVVHESGLVYLSGTIGGDYPMNDDPERVRHGFEGGQFAADVHIRALHWTLSCGGEGDLNDVLYTGGMGSFASDGVDPGGFAGVHARSAMGGFDGRFSIEPEMIVAIPPSLASEIVGGRGWVYPLPPAILERVVSARA